jgi:hypothetical protein
MLINSSMSLIMVGFAFSLFVQSEWGRVGRPFPSTPIVEILPSKIPVNIDVGSQINRRKIVKFISITQIIL